MALALGMGGAFAVLGVGVAALGPTHGLTADKVGAAAARVMVGFGLVMVFPVLGDIFTDATARFATCGDVSTDAAKCANNWRGSG